jgi:hypothetical protein
LFIPVGAQSAVQVGAAVVAGKSTGAMPHCRILLYSTNTIEHNLQVLDYDAERILKDIGIPLCPVILTNLMREMRGEKPDFVTVGKLIGGDMSLAAG